MGKDGKPIYREGWESLKGQIILNPIIVDIWIKKIA